MTGCGSALSTASAALARCDGRMAFGDAHAAALQAKIGERIAQTPMNVGRVSAVQNAPVAMP